MAVFLALFFDLQAQYVVNGNATAITGNWFRLTNNLQSQGGYVWYQNFISLNSNFDMEFQVFLGHNDWGADGIAFVMQPNSTGAGVNGGGLGYQGISPSLAVEYDTYQNDDPAYDHIAIHRNGDVNSSTGAVAGPVQASASSPNIEDGQWHTTKITWNATTKTLSVFFDGVFRLSYTNDIVANIFGGNPAVYWGFTGATGWASNIQEFRVISTTITETLKVNTSSSNVTCNGANNGTATVTSVLGGTAPYVFNGWFINGSTLYSTSTSISGLAPGTYTAKYKDSRDTVGTNSVTITEPPLVTVTNPTPNSRCGTGSVALGATASEGAIDWYENSTGGTSLGTGNTFNTPSISSSRVYYAQATNNGCTSAPRTPVAATIYFTPGAPVTVNASGVTSSSFSANWSSVTGAAHYLLDVSSVSDFSTFLAGYDGKTVSGNSENLTGLNAGNYYFRTRAVSADNCTGTNSSVVHVFVSPLSIIWNGNSWNYIPDAATGHLDALVMAGDPGPISANSAVKTLTINSGATLNVLSGVTFQIRGNLINNGSANLGNGTVTFNGTAAQTLSGNCDIWNLKLDNTAGLTISTSPGAVKVMNHLTLTSGVLRTNNKLNLVAISPNQYGQISPEGTGSITGNVSMEMMITGGAGWKHVSSPFLGVTLAQINSQFPLRYSGSSTNIYRVAENTTSKWVLTSGGAELMNQRGYTIWFTGPLKLRLTGTYSKASFTTPNLTFTPYSGPDPSLVEGWHLIGNPYPSHLDWNSIIDGNQPQNLRNSYAIWRSSSNQYGYYSVDGEIGPFSTLGLNQFIPPMHGFWVGCTAPTTGLSIENNDRTVVVNNNYLNKKNIAKNLLRISVTSDNKEYSDETVLSFSGKNLLREEGVIKLNVSDNKAVSLFTKGSVKYAIQKFSPIEDEVRIPLFFEYGVTGTYTLSWSSEDMEQDVSLYIWDNLTKVKHDLHKGSFEFFHSITNGNQPRFMLIAEKSVALSVKKTNVAQNEANRVYASGNSVHISFGGGDSEKTAVEIFDMTGRKVYSDTENTSGDNQKQIVLSGVKPGYYIVRITGKHSPENHKVFITE